MDLQVGDIGDGPPLVLLHAFPLSSAMWSRQVDALGNDYRIITPDQRGFGGSPLGDYEPSLDLVADDVAALLDDLGLDDVVLGGLSMGGYVAMALLRRHPQRVRAVILADTKASADPELAKEKRLRIASRLDAEGAPGALIDEVLPALCGPTTKRDRPDVAEYVAEMVRAAPPAAAAWAQRAMAARPDSHDTLRSTDVPALVVLGDEDELSSRWDADAMVEALPKGRLEVLEGSGHLTAVEVPDAFTAVVVEFLDQVHAAS